MARTMKDANKCAFNKIINFIESRNEFVPDGVRYFFTNDVEKDWLKNLTQIRFYRHNTKQQIICVSLNEDNYVISIGFDFELDSNDEIFSSIELNAGIFTYILSETSIKLNDNIDLSQLVSFTYPFKSEDILYKGHDFKDFIEFFDVIKIFRINSDSVLNFHDAHQLTSYLVLKSINSCLLLNYSIDTLNSFERIILNTSSGVSFENILSAILSSSYKHCFLELYRNIEKLFPIIKLNCLYENVEASVDFMSFWNSVDDIIKWKPNEEGTLEFMLEKVSPQTKKIIESIPDAESSTGKFIYKLRNAIVHYRLSSNKIDLSDDNWNIIIQLLSEITIEQYNFYKEKLVYV